MTDKKYKLENFGLEKIEVGGEKIGVMNDSIKIAVLTPIVLIKERNQLLYKKKVCELDRQGYEIAYNHSNGEPQEVTHKRVYDILPPLNLNKFCLIP